MCSVSGDSQGQAPGHSQLPLLSALLGETGPLLPWTECRQLISTSKALPLSPPPARQSCCSCSGKGTFMFVFLTLQYVKRSVATEASVSLVNKSKSSGFPGQLVAGL